MNFRPDDIRQLLGWRYRIIRELGGGGTASVFLADDLAAGRPVALKASADSGALKREYISLHRHRHPGLIEPRDLCQFPDFSVLATEYFPGAALGELCLPIEQLYVIWSQLADVLEHLHWSGIIHGDLKPEHILVDGDRMKLIDMGMSGRCGARSGFGFQGTVAYAAPELLSGQGEATMRSDIYSLGLVIWGALGNRLPVLEEKVDPDAAWCNLPAGQLSPMAAEVLRRMLRFAPETRHASGSHLTEALRAARVYQPSSVRPVLPFTGRGQELKAALAPDGEAESQLTIVSGAPGTGISRFLSELGFLLRVTGKNCVRIDGAPANTIDWKKAPGAITVLIDHASSEQIRALRSTLPAGVRLICSSLPGNETLLTGPLRAIELDPFPPGDLEKLLQRFLREARPRDTAALARNLTALSAGNIGTAGAYLRRYLDQGWIDAVHGQWRIDWQQVLGDRGIPQEIEDELSRLWDKCPEGERAALKRACAINHWETGQDVAADRWQRFLGVSEEQAQVAAECLRRFVCARISDDETRAILGSGLTESDPVPDRVRWDLLAMAGLWPEWLRQGQALLCAAEAARDAEAIIYYGGALLQSGKLIDTEAVPVAIRLFRLSARMGREIDAERAWRALAVLPGISWEMALEAARYFAGAGKKSLAEECLRQSTAAAPAGDAEIGRRLNACRVWIEYKPDSNGAYPAELLALARTDTSSGQGSVAEAEANEYLAQIALRMNDWKQLSLHAEVAVKHYTQANASTTLGSAWLLLCYGLWHLDKLNEAVSALQQCLLLLDDGLPNSLLASAWEQMVLIKIARRQWDEAEQCLASIELELPQPVPISNLAYLEAMRGVIHSGQGDHTLVKESQIEAAALCFESGDHANYAICLANAAIEGNLLGNNVAADAILKRALEHSHSYAAAHAELIVLKDLCRIVLERGRHDEAWEWFERGRALSQDKDLRLMTEHIASGALAAVMLGKEDEACGLLALLAKDKGSEAAQCWHGLVDGEQKVRLGKDYDGVAIMITAGERFLALGLELEAANAWLRAAEAALACGLAQAPEPLIAALVRAETICQRHQAKPALDRVRMALLALARQLKNAATVSGTDPVLLSGIYELTGLLGAATDPDKIAGAAVKLAVRLLDAERGGLFLLDGHSRLTLVAQVNLDPDTQRDALDFSRDTVLAAAGTGREIVSNDAQLDEAFNSRLSVQRNAIRSLLAVPVSYREGAIGALYLDTRLKSGVFSPQRREFLKALAAIIGSVIESGRLMAKLRQENRELKAGRSPTLDRIVGKSPAIRELLERIRTAAAADVRVLMEGETGTGKELAARAIHELSGRSDRTFLALDCGSLPENLLEAELFGSVKGAFTGAYADKKGLFEAADGGTLFLDEITSASLGVQSRLLRAIEAGEIRRVGDTAVRSVDVRLICATNKDLEVEINDGRFKEDLYYRLNVVRLRIPPLRERAGDIMLLAEHYRQEFQRQHKKRGLNFSDAARECLLHYVWPGNIRELEHVVKRAVIMADGPVIGPADLEIQDDDFPVTTIRQETDHVKRVKVIEALRMSDGNVSKAAGRLGMSRRQVQRLMRKYEIE